MNLAKMTLLLASLCLASAVSAAPAGEAAEVKMTLLPSGAMSKMGGYMPQRLNLVAEKPDDLKKAPDLAAPLFGSIKFGEKSYLVALDEPDGKDATLYVDANGNGDLTDDPSPTWTKKPRGTDPKLFQYSGSFKLPLVPGDAATMVSISCYRLGAASAPANDPKSPTNAAPRAALNNVAYYYADYAYEGEITLGAAKYHAMLVDNNATGDFRGKALGSAPVQTAGGLQPPTSGVRLLIDLNADGRFSGVTELYDVKEAFNIKGTTWEVADLKADGTFKIVKSAKTVAEKVAPPPPKPSPAVGAKMAFKATKMDGTPVNFPEDYKGKLVMLDFWATWCGPCMSEVPGLVKAYNEYHGKGIEILGISLDQTNAVDKIKTVTGEKGMTWPQVYDGKYWQADLAVKHNIHAIPAPFLIDGDTGEVLAKDADLRGDKLAETFKAALEKKAAKDKK